MAFLHGWIRDIVIIILLASFLEMLLPNSEMKKFARLVIGLFIILTILNPLLVLLERGKNMDTATLALKTASEEKEVPNRSQGEELKQVALQQKGQEAVLKEYKKGISKQIETLALLVGGVVQAKAVVTVEENKESKNFGTIKNIELYVKTGDSSRQAAGETGTAIGEIKPVKINLQEPSQDDQNAHEKPVTQEINPQIRDSIVKLITRYYALTSQQVEVLGWEQ